MHSAGTHVRTHAQTTIFEYQHDLLQTSNFFRIAHARELRGVPLVADLSERVCLLHESVLQLAVQGVQLAPSGSPVVLIRAARPRYLTMAALKIFDHTLKILQLV